MARVNKKEVVKKEVKQVKTSGITGVREESPKGELFFKIVLIIMAAGLLGITLFFVFDTIFNKKDDEFVPKYHENNYVTLADITLAQTEGVDYANIQHSGLKYALDKFTYVYVVFVAEFDTENIDDSVLERQEPVLSIVDNIFALDSKQELEVEDETDSDYTIITIGSDTAIFFLDITQAGNEDYKSAVVTEEGQAASASLPVMLEVVDGYDFNWYGPWTAIDKNMSTESKLTEVLESLK